MFSNTNAVARERDVSSWYQGSVLIGVKNNINCCSIGVLDDNYSFCWLVADDGFVQIKHFCDTSIGSFQQRSSNFEIVR
jgi:hypothetical protein